MRPKSVEKFKAKVRRTDAPASQPGRDGHRETQLGHSGHGELLRHLVFPRRRSLSRLGPLDTHASPVYEVQAQKPIRQRAVSAGLFPSAGSLFLDRVAARSRVGDGHPPRKGQASWRRPVPERGTPVNRGNRPPRDNGEGGEWPPPLPTYEGASSMSGVALVSLAVRRPAINPWIIAAAVVVPTFMEVLDTTIANVALRYIAGGLSAAETDSEWVITSYLAANAIILPISGWLSAHLGRRNYFLLSIAVFTLASALCGMATQPGADHPVPGDPGPGRRRTPAEQPGGLAGQLPAREAGHGHDDVRHRGPDRAHRRPDAGRLARGQLRLALDLLHQRPGGPAGAGQLLLPGQGSGLPQAGAGRAAPQAAELRLHRPGAARAGHGQLGNHAQQGAGVGLAGRPVLASADADHVCSCWGSASLSSGRCGLPTRSSTSACWASATSPCAASSSSAPSPCCTPPAFRCRPCSRPCSATTPWPRGWCCLPRASPRSA